MREHADISVCLIISIIIIYQQEQYNCIYFVYKMGLNKLTPCIRISFILQ